MDSKDPVIEKTEQVIKALGYAQEHNLNIQNVDDVKKILEVIDPENVTDENVTEFMKLLQGSDSLIEEDADRRSKIN